MKPINLVPFADYSEKLPSELLTPVPDKERTSTLKVLTAHMIDFAMVFVLTSSMAAIFGQAIQSMMVTKGLKLIFSDQMVFGVSATLLPFIVFNYFFLSYFMNHGQTCGMYLLKRRMEMRATSFMDALKSASHSFILCFSCGTSFVAQRSVWRKFKGHDYLYDNLFAHQESDAINLLGRIDVFEAEKLIEEDSWKKAA